MAKIAKAEYEALASDIDARCEALGDGARVTADELLAAARMQRASAAPGPDGWSGGYLRRIATLFPRETAKRGCCCGGWKARSGRRFNHTIKLKL